VPKRRSPASVGETVVDQAELIGAIQALDGLKDKSDFDVRCWSSAGLKVCQTGFRIAYHVALQFLGAPEVQERQQHRRREPYRGYRFELCPHGRGENEERQALLRNQMRQMTVKLPIQRGGTFAREPVLDLEAGINDVMQAGYGGPIRGKQALALNFRHARRLNGRLEKASIATRRTKPVKDGQFRPKRLLQPSENPVSKSVATVAELGDAGAVLADFLPCRDARRQSLVHECEAQRVTPDRPHQRIQHRLGTGLRKVAI